MKRYKLTNIPLRINRCGDEKRIQKAPTTRNSLFSFRNNSFRVFQRGFANLGTDGDSPFEEVVKIGANRLKEIGIENSHFEAKLLLSKILQIRYPKIKTQVTKEQQQLFEEHISRREKWEPIAYIIGEKEFYGRSFKCTPKETLIPRPDSELFVDVALKIFKSFYYLGERKEVKIIEGGVGTGALIISIIAEIEQFLSNQSHKEGYSSQMKISGLGVDIHPAALLTTQQNIVFHNLQNQINLLSSNWFSEVKDLGDYQIIISNPPYIPNFELQSLHPTVKEWEPLIALEGGEDGLFHYREISNQLSNAVQRATSNDSTLFVLLEVGYNQATEVADYFQQNNDKLRLIWIQKDLAQFDRLLVFTNNFELRFDTIFDES